MDKNKHPLWCHVHDIACGCGCTCSVGTNDPSERGLMLRYDGRDGEHLKKDKCKKRKLING